MTRIAVIEKEKCNPMGCGGYLCMKLCPVNRMGEECIVKASDNKPLIDEKLCTGCGICPNRCPFDAISIINLPEELAKQPIHRYGRNGFHLYNLPVPQFGKVVGILGRNGIGKSTALKILADMLKPNLGKDEEAGCDELIEFFKGSEAQNFFEKLKNSEIKVSYKPQQVDLIPKNSMGKVKDLLAKVDEKGELDNIAKELEIGKILDSDIKNISGGELQRVAIAAAVLKKANVYFFDEPTSYLDIKQRISISKFIRSLADDATAVLIVEHDLIILDYMTDMLHIMYGKESVYGIVSGPKSTRNGINIYLSGYLKEENMRFRDKPIKFSERAEKSKSKGDLQAAWKNIHKKFGKFSLSAEQGEVKKNDIIGILGENGIGKTSFVKLLAGVDKTDSGEINEKVKVSYKPQYLRSGSGQAVDSVLSDAISKYTTQIINPLRLQPLFGRKINELSGGELQKVSIALCLSKKADLYLLDEPSAYLDVEQRLLISKLIADIMHERGASAMIVDHDLLFLDYLSSKLMVFEGIPAEYGQAKGPFDMEQGMTHFLKKLNISMRRDTESRRPRVNKLNSVKDREQKAKNKLYYS
ncbi:ribosome biogenesis/translation initiation ATPase RLI [Candidatus Woesearchaeota archaeon]|nr:ribosome biogenesis/translation initiation ATPase RLI [Candidatus Woesearchaeota archaeon]